MPTTRTTRRLRRIAALVAVWLLLIVAPTKAEPVTPVELRFGDRDLWLFTRFPDMGSCELVRLANCFRFADGTVVAQISLLLPVNQLLGLVRQPLGGCTKIPSFGSSSHVVEVRAGAGDILVVGPGPCAELPGQLADHTAYLVLPGVPQTIPPTDASVADLASVLR